MCDGRGCCAVVSRAETNLRGSQWPACDGRSTCLRSRIRSMRREESSVVVGLCLLVGCVGKKESRSAQVH